MRCMGSTPVDCSESFLDRNRAQSSDLSAREQKTLHLGSDSRRLDCIMPNINPANGSSSPRFSIRSTGRYLVSMMLFIVEAVPRASLAP